MTEQDQKAGQGTENFADAPMGLDEVRASRSGEADDLSPRSALVRLLREIDSGRIKPTALALIYQTEDNGIRADYATKERRHATLGMLQTAIFDLLAM